MLVKCYDCQTEFSDSARLCPTCGAPRRIQPVDPSNIADDKPRTRYGRAVRIIFVGLAIAIFVYGCSFLGRVP
jgi:predicted amidophosphoribosyltransferase